MLELKDVYITFFPNTVNEKKALNGLNLKLNKGDYTTVIGSNGAGKSTLFSVIAGNYKLDSGKVLIDGNDVTNLPEYKRSQDIGRLFQDPMKGTAPTMTIEENLALAYLRAKKNGGAFSKIGKKEKELFSTKLEELGLGLENRMNSPVGMLSGGQRQALTLLMATLVTPKILLLDEHTAALDPATAEKVIDLTERIIKKNNITCLMITHNISSSIKQGNRTIMMDNGRIVLDIEGEERKQITVQALLEEFRKNADKELDNDRILLSI